MKLKSFEHMNCSLAQALEVVGERWTLLILRDAFFGIHRFDDFQRRLGIARNILSARLARLVEAGILERRALSAGGKRAEYHLTAKGRDLQPALVSLTQWGDAWYPGDGGPRIEFYERESGEPIRRLRPCAQDGRELTPRQIRARPGPGAEPGTAAVLDIEGTSS
ncbi:MAG TPA: helix-turn-helix domain-containing protein [Pseudomonadales bacterium]|nr:helix-turn-helix domain-containing protein [Pseudomonadales bacterium]